MSASQQESSKLFRDEVFAARRSTWLGQVVLIRPLSFTLLTAVAVVLAAVVLTFLFWGEYTRKARVAGYVVPVQRLIKVAPSQAGVITQLRVQEGQEVKQGEVLALLNSKRATAAGEVQARVEEQDRIENESRREIQLTAPQAGTVTAIVAQPGKLAIAGQPLLTMIPQGASLRAVVYVPARAVGFIHAGARVLLQYQSFPYQKFGSHEGRIVSVSRIALDSNELPFPAPQEELFYIASIDLAKQTITAYGKEQPLHAGMRVDCSILLERHTLFEWVLEPLYSISGRRSE